MNISHNYSGLTDDVLLFNDDSDSVIEEVPHCLDEQSLRELIYRPSALFFRKPDELE